MDKSLISKTGKGKITVRGGCDKIGFYTSVSYDGYDVRVFRSGYCSESEAMALGYAEAMARARRCKIVLGDGVSHGC